MTAALVMEALRPDHLEGFATQYPLAPMPDDQWGEAVAFVLDGEVLAIAGGWHREGAVEIGLLTSTEARRYPVLIHKTALKVLRDTDRVGWRLRAWPVDYTGARWLRRLGFEPVNSGAFERCPSLPHC